ncbi:MAG: hypothetical protein HYR91_02320 [Flavobacteriia bacterium]|nr:hypothetical protein [Flavobacteriia bacterium]
MYRFHILNFILILHIFSFYSCQSTTSDFEILIYNQTLKEIHSLKQYGDFKYTNFFNTSNSDNFLKNTKRASFLKSIIEINQKTGILIQNIEKIKTTICHLNHSLKNNDNTTTKSQIQIHDIDIKAIAQNEIATNIVKKIMKKSINFIRKYRKEALESLTNYQNNMKHYYFKDPDYNGNLNKQTYSEKLDKILNLKTTNYYDDGEIIKQIYFVLTEIIYKTNQKITSNYFEQTNTCQLIIDLMIMEKEVMKVRNLCLTHVSSRITSCDFAFNYPLITTEGPGIVKKGEIYIVKINYALYDKYSNLNISTSLTENVNRMNNGISISKIMEEKDLLFEGKLFYRKLSGEISTYPFTKRISHFSTSKK